MKLETKTADIRLTLAARDAELEAARSKHALVSAVDQMATGPRPVQDPLAVAIELRRRELAAKATLAKVPAPRRSLASTAIKIAERLADAAARTGGSYSGAIHWAVRWGERAEATTMLATEAQYSRRCTYKMNDATHLVTLDPAGVPLLAECEALAIASARDGLPLIAIYPGCRATWVRRDGKRLTQETGWIVGNGAHCFHSTVSLDDANRKFSRKLDSIKREAEERRRNRKAERRAALVVRLCRGAVATIADAKALGYCEPGIRSFQSRHGLGDSASLPDLIRTGDPSAVRLALAVARKVQHA